MGFLIMRFGSEIMRPNPNGAFPSFRTMEEGKYSMGLLLLLLTTYMTSLLGEDAGSLLSGFTYAAAAFATTYGCIEFCKYGIGERLTHRNLESELRCLRVMMFDLFSSERLA